MDLNIQNMAQIFLYGVSGFIPAVLFYSVIAVAVIRFRLRVEDAKPAEFYSNRHIYHPQRVIPIFKVVLSVAAAIFFCFMLPYMAMYISFNSVGYHMYPLALIVFFAGLALTIMIIKRPDGSTVESLTVDSAALTVKYRGGGTESYECRQYAGYNSEAAGCTVFVFRDGNGTEVKLPVRGLPDWDMNMLREDLDRVRQTGNIAAVKKSSAGAGAGSVKQTAQITPAKQAAQKKREEYYADPANYERHLQRVADKLMPAKKAEIIKLINEGEKLRAVTMCHKQTDCSLKDAKDIVESYKKYLSGAEEQPGRDTDDEIRGMGAETLRTKEDTDSFSADPGQYALYLKEEAGKLSKERREALLALIRSGDMMTAVRQCREWTHLGIKQAKDLVESYRTYLIDSNEPDMVMAMPEAVSTFMPQLPPPSMPVYGFGYDMPGTEPNRGSWTLRVTDNEQSVTDARSLERNIDAALSGISRKKEEFFVLAPAEPIHGISFMQVCQDKSGVYFHLEAGLEGVDAQGRQKIFCRDKLMGWEARNLCLSFYRGEEIYMADWNELNRVDQS
ncbi:MAG: G-protein coupled receptor [Lachnospiraceae bacterium]|nr:G-protein coupled receptor [Lachnospiraceae bacterium]